MGFPTSLLVGLVGGSAIGGSEISLLPEGHLSIKANHVEEILGWLW